MPQVPIQLRRAQESDLEFFFLFQLDEEANYLAAFTAKDPSDKEAYLKKYTAHLRDPDINTQTILADGSIAGSIARFEIEGNAEISYWIDKALWGNGIATTALRQFLLTETTRPLFARVAFDNLGSQRVLEHCGFIKTGTDSGFANARQAEIEEFIYQLS